jgi:hypothetical protein
MARRNLWIRTTRTERPAAVDNLEKQAIIAACETFIRDILKPRFLPEIRPTEWNYVVDIRGSWAGGRYRFMQRYRSGMEHNRGEEFDAPFARIDRIGRDRFDIYWMRHTGGGGSTPASRSSRRFVSWRQTVSCIHTDRRSPKG